MKRRLLLIAGMSLLCVSQALADSLDREARKAFRRIGIGPEQAEAYAIMYEEFLSKRYAFVRRTMHRSSGEEVPVKVKMAAARAARRSIKDMKKVLNEKQLEYYEAYIKLDNKQFLRDTGLR